MFGLVDVFADLDVPVKSQDEDYVTGWQDEVQLQPSGRGWCTGGLPVLKLSESGGLGRRNMMDSWLPYHTSTSECVVTSHRRRRMLVLLPPQGLPLRKTGGSVTHRSSIFSATVRTDIQSQATPYADLRNPSPECHQVG